MTLNKSNYFEDEYYFSTSIWKRFNECEKLGLEPFGEPTESMLVGSYVDSWVEGTLDEFIKKHPEIISSRGKTKGQLKAGFRKADEIIDYLKHNKTFMQFFQDEKQKIMTGEISGVPVKIMMDNYSEGIAINDLKVMNSVTKRNGEYYDFISQWGYQYQGAIYQNIVYQNTGELLPFFICAVTKEEPINSVIVNIPQDILDSALYEVENTIERYYKVWIGMEEPIGCGKCKVCISQRIETPIISMDDIINREVNIDV